MSEEETSDDDWFERAVSGDARTDATSDTKQQDHGEPDGETDQSEETEPGDTGPVTGGQQTSHPQNADGAAAGTSQSDLDGAPKTPSQQPRRVPRPTKTVRSAVAAAVRVRSTTTSSRPSDQPAVPMRRSSKTRSPSRTFHVSTWG